MSNRLFAVLLLLLLMAMAAGGASAAGSPKYTVHYTVQFQPEAGSAAVDISTQPGTGRLIAMDLNMPAAIYSKNGSHRKGGSQARRKNKF